MCTGHRQCEKLCHTYFCKTIFASLNISDMYYSRPCFGTDISRSQRFCGLCFWEWDGGFLKVINRVFFLLKSIDKVNEGYKAHKQKPLNLLEMSSKNKVWYMGDASIYRTYNFFIFFNIVGTKETRDQSKSGVIKSHKFGIGQKGMVGFVCQ